MSPSNGTLLSTCKSPSHLQKNSAKRSLFTSLTDSDVSDISCKRKKINVHSHEDINNAVQTTSNGYMTRNRLKLIKNSDIELESKCLNVKEKKSSKNNKPSNHSGKDKKNRKSTNKTKRKLELGYVFTRDIFLQCSEHQQTTERKKMPSLFESDSECELEINNFQINNNTDEVESKSISVLKSEIMRPTFYKNSGVKTYFNKKSCSSNSKLNKTPPKMVKNCFKNPSNITNHIKNFNENINNLPEISNLSGTQKTSHVTNNIKCNVEKSKGSGMNSHYSKLSSLDLSKKDMTNQNNICMKDNIVDEECSMSSSSLCSSLEQNIDLNGLVGSELLSLKTSKVTENNLSSIFDVPNTQTTLVKKEDNLNVNCISENCISYPVSKTPKKNYEVYNSLSNDFENKPFEVTEINLSSIFDVPNTQTTLVKKEDNLNVNCISENCISYPVSKTPIKNYEVYNSLSNNFENGASEVTENNLSSIFDVPNTQTTLVKKEDNLNVNCISENCISYPVSKTPKKNYEVYNSLSNDFENKPFEVTEINLSSIFYVPNTKTTLVKKEDNLNVNCITENCISYPVSKTPKKNIEVYNSFSNDFENGASDQSVDNHLMLEQHNFIEVKNIELPNRITHKYFHSINKNNGKRKSETLISEMENDNSSSLVNNSSKKSKSEKFDSKCHCKIFYRFNKNANKILTSKTNHFVFNTNTEKFRQKVLHQKYLEASILEMLITKDNKNIIKPEKLSPTSNTLLINLSDEKKVHVKEDDHIEPTILNMLKDVYVDLEYVSEYCDYNKYVTPLELHVSKNKPIDTLYSTKIINNITTNEPTVNNTTTNEPTDITIIPCEQNNVNSGMVSSYNTKTNGSANNIKVCFNKKKNCCNDIVSNITNVKVPPVPIVSYEEINMDSGKQKKSETLNISKTNKADNVKPCHENNVASNIHKFDLQNSSAEQKESNKDEVFCEIYTKLNTNDVNNIEYNCMYSNADQIYDLKTEDIKYKTDIEIKPFNLYSSSNDPISMKENDNECENSKHFENKSIKSNIEFIQSKLTYGIKEENKSVSSPIESNIPENVFKMLKPPVYKNIFETNDFKYTASSINDQNKHDFPIMQQKSEQPKYNLFNVSNNDIQDSLSNSSSDDDARLQIEDDEDIVENLKDLVVNYNLPSVKNCTTVKEFCEMKCIDSKKEQPTKINVANDDKETVLKPIILNEETDLFNNKCENLLVSKEENPYLANCTFMTFEMCDNFYKNKALNNSTSYTNTFFSKKIKDILKETYVDDIFVTLCQHMVETCEDQTFSQTISKQINRPIERLVNDIEYKTDDNKIYPAFNKLSTLTSTEIISKTEVNSYQKNNEPIISIIKSTKSNSPLKIKNVKSNMKIRIIFRNLISSDKKLNEILESKEFRSLRFFEEEEIACSIGVFIFEQIIDPPIITGLSAYKENYDQKNDEEKNKELGSTNLSIICPMIMKLTTITLALVKMLRSNNMIDLILNVIRKNLLNKKMNTNHTIDNQLITQTVYFVDICVRLRLLKTLQTFIFDSMVLLPNKYCCVIFVSLLLWKNCLPRRVNNEIDPVIITVMSYLIAKKKFYSEQIVGRDIFQRELINLLSFHFNYTFVIDMPYNFIQHVHKPDFFISVVMFLKCCNPKDSVEFMVNCIFPIVEGYLNSQQNETNAIKVMESIYLAVKPFRIACNSTVAIYLKKCKGAINGTKKDEKEHIYNSIYNSYKIMQNKFVEYLNDTRPRSQSFEESLISIIMVLGSADYVTSCVSLMKWKPTFQLSTILSKKINMFKSIIGHPLWDKLCVIDDTDLIKCLVNSCILKKDVYNTIIRLHSLH